MTGRDVYQLIQCLEQVFTIVRLVDPEEKTVWSIEPNGELVKAGCCYLLWKTGSGCENCASKKAAEKSCSVSKYEQTDDKIYHMESRIIDVDGRKLNLEIISAYEDRDSILNLPDRTNKRDKEIIEVLTSEYTGVYFVNLKSGEATPYSMNKTVESEVGEVFQGDVKYVDTYRFCVENLVYNEDKSIMAAAGTIGNIMKELRNKKTFETIYRDNFGKYCEMKFIKMGDSEGVPEAVALCFSEKDAELRAKEESDLRLRKNLEIINILASEYTSVYYIDMKTDDLDTYTMNEKTESEFGQIFRSGIKYSNAFKMYVDTLVYPADREMMLKAGSVYNILDELADKKSFNTRYRNSEGRYCEMKFVKVGDEEFPKAVALGFSENE